jgi:hypothetical protein
MHHRTVAECMTGDVVRARPDTPFKPFAPLDLRRRILGRGWGVIRVRGATCGGTFGPVGVPLGSGGRRSRARR